MAYTPYGNTNSNVRRGITGLSTDAGLDDAKKQAERSDDFGVNDKRFDSLVYPIKMNPDNFYPEAMCFTIKKRVGVGLGDVAEAVEGEWKSRVGLQDQRKKIEETRKSGIEAAKNIPDKKDREQALADIQQRATRDQDKISQDFMDDVFGGVGSVKKQMVELRSNRETAAKTTHANNLGHIYLNMPNGIQFENDASWDAKPLGAIGAITKDVLGAGGSAGAGLGAVTGHAGTMGGAAIGGMIGFLADKLRIPSGVGIGALAGVLAGGSGIQGGIEATLGVVTNPYEEMMFSGITFRSFSFDFIFRPEGYDEIQMVHSIIEVFRRYSRPSFTGGAMGKSVMDYPMEFEIQFLTAENGKPKLKDRHGMEESLGGDVVYTENNHLPKIKPCVCDKVSTNYTPHGVWSAYAKGAPIAITMGLGFKEKELVMEQDIKGGY